MHNEYETQHQNNTQLRIKERVLLMHHYIARDSFTYFVLYLYQPQQTKLKLGGKS